METRFFDLPIAVGIGGRNNGALSGPTSSAGNDLHERPDAEDIDHPLHVVGKHLQTHISFDLFKGSGQEMSAAGYGCAINRDRRSPCGSKNGSAAMAAV